jgi:DNA-binding transcriptional ArsR family regulator
VSHHLKVLQSAGLVEREKRGRWAFYRVCPEPFLALQGALAPPALRTPGRGEAVRSQMAAALLPQP